MEEKEVTYLLIREKIVAKRVFSGENGKNYLFKDGKWVEDSDHVVMDHMVGYDPFEPEDSPYRFGSTDILAEMEEISWDIAVSIMNQQILELLKNNWKAEFKPRKEEWDKAPGWPAKHVETEFTLNGISYSLRPADIGLTNDGWDQGFMESIQTDIRKDLESYGATDIYNLGFID